MGIGNWQPEVKRKIFGLTGKHKFTRIRLEMKAKKTQDNKHVKESKDDKQVVTLKAQLARALADYDNLVKRVDRERETFVKLSSLGIVSKLLPVVDGLENANNHLKDPGLAILTGDLKKILTDEGLTEIKPEVGSNFDENAMDAVEIVKGEQENTIAEVVMVGWRYSDLSGGRHGGQVIRHAKVKVYKK